MLTALVIAAATCGLAACGDDGESGRGVTLNWWARDEPGAKYAMAVDRCNQQSGGRYQIKFNALGNDADTQRQQLVRRLAAEDDSIDLMNMDVVWTAEFAEAGWAKRFPDRNAAEIRSGSLKGPLQSATYKGQLYAAPLTTNTQLLWYRKSLVKQPPTTWDELIESTRQLRSKVSTPGAAYEGTTVWFNSLLESAGGRVLKTPETEDLGAGTERALQIMSRFSHDVADPSFSTMKEDQARLAFEQGNLAYQVNYPFIYASAKEGNPDLLKDLGWAPYPRVDRDKPVRAPLGGLNIGVGGNSKHATEAFEAAACLTDETSQRQYAREGGLPPTFAAIYDDPKFVEAYPMAPIIRDQVNNAAVRPSTPRYADVSLAIYGTLSPPTGYDPKSVLGELRENVKNALESKGLL